MSACSYCHGARLVGWSGAGPILCPECSRGQDAFTVITQAWREQRYMAADLAEKLAAAEERARVATERLASIEAAYDKLAEAHEAGRRAMAEEALRAAQEAAFAWASTQPPDDDDPRPSEMAGAIWRALKALGEAKPPAPPPGAPAAECAWWCNTGSTPMANCDCGAPAEPGPKREPVRCSSISPAPEGFRCGLEEGHDGDKPARRGGR